MGALGDEFRQSAQAQSAAADSLFQSDDFNTNPVKQATAIIGKVNSTLYSVAAKLADQREFPELNKRESLLEKRLVLLRQNDAIRQAAASGDWSTFDKLVAELSGAIANGDGQQSDDSGTTGSGNAS